MRALHSAFLAVLLGASAVPAQAPNLLPNASFERLDGDGAPVGWRPNTWSGEPAFAVERGFGRSGGQCVKISSATGADASWSHEVAVRPGTRYRLSAWIKLRGFDRHTGLGAQLNLHQLQMQGKTTALTATDADWTRVESTFDSGEHRTLLVNLLFGGWGQSTGEAWFDDVELVDLTPPPPVLGETEKLAYFRERVHPILERNCFQCHGPDSKVRGRLFLGNRASLLRGGESGPAVNLDQPRASLLVRAVNYDVFEMPPKGKLPPETVATLTEWLRLGAPYDPALEAATPAAALHVEAPKITDQHRAHWAFQPVVQPEPPRVDTPGWQENAIDAFVAARLEDSGLTPGPRADRQTLARRAYHDVLGLPPTPAQVRAFVADDSPDAYERLIDELLASPHYGERWARHWLDVVRYAESNSFERDNPKPFVWRYRDYVIDAFNQDKPFDRFVLEQLAGDELDEVTPETIIATGYYRLGQWDDEPADPEQARFDELDDIVTTTAQGLLGITVNCARCHDHKLDPILQADYYRMVAFFRGVRRYGVRSEPSVRERSVRIIASAEEQEQHKAQLAEHDAAIAALEAEMQALAAAVREKFTPVDHEEFAHERNQVAILEKHYGDDAPEVKRFQQLLRQRNHKRNRPPDARAKALCVKERGPDAPPTHVLVRGNPHVPGPLVEPGFPTVLGFDDPEISPPPHGASTGRRLALARWIASPDNPLTPRVLVNRLWQHHFGAGIVPSSNDFGLEGRPPSHPQLLDWLAAELVRGDFKVKRLHKLILTSRTWTQDYRRDARAARIDPDNRLLWRFEPRRMTAEELRDSVLAVCGNLNPALHGPSVYPVVPPEVLAGQSRPGAGWPTSRGADRHRRSVYVHVKRSMLLPILEAFDAADTDFTCPVRFETTQPTQALAMLNSDFLGEQAAAFADDLRAAYPDDVRAQVDAALWRTLQRAPTDAEVDRGLAFVRELRHDEQYDARRALARFCLVALNLNEFVYLR